MGKARNSTVVKGTKEIKGNHKTKVRRVQRFVDLVCVGCSGHWYSVEPICNYSDNDRHHFELEETWSDLPSTKVYVCWHCGHLENTTPKCKSSADKQHSFLEVDLLDDTSEDEN